MPTPPVLRRSLLLPALVAVAIVAGACSSDPASIDATTSTSRPAATTSTTEDRSEAPAETVTVFRSGEASYDTFRIPAIVAAADGTLLAFAEGRLDSPADAGDVDLVLKRSDDGGRTWGELEVIGADGANFVGNPSPVVDQESGRVVLLAIHKDGRDDELEILTGSGVDSSRVWLLASDDDGETWGEPEDITAEVKAPEWRWYAVGPGHAIQLRNGRHAGRLVVAANHSHATRGYGDHALISDDGGLTWELGADDTPNDAVHAPDENAAAELPDGNIVFSSRNQDEGADWHRLRTTSADGGESFTAPYAKQVGLTVPVVQGSLLWAGGDDGRLLFSAPSDRSERIDLVIRSSSDAGMTWSEGTPITTGPAGYSDLIELTSNRIGVLHEAGETAPFERIDLTILGGAHVP